MTSSNSGKLSDVDDTVSMESLNCPLCHFSCLKNQLLQEHVYNQHSDILQTPEKENKTFKSSVSVSLDRTPTSSSTGRGGGSNPAVSSYSTCPFCDAIFGSDAIETHVESHLLDDREDDTNCDETLAAQLELEERRRNEQQLEQLSKKKVEEMYFQVISKVPPFCYPLPRFIPNLICSAN